MKCIPLLCLWASLASCHARKKAYPVRSAVSTPIKTVDFAAAFYDTTRTLAQLKSDFPLFFNPATADSVWRKKRRDTLERSLYKAVEAQHLTWYEPQLAALFKRVKSYYADFKSPTTYWYVSDVDWQNPVFYRDSVLLTAGDLFLGADARFYQGIPRYISARFEAGQLLPRVALALAQSFVFPPEVHSFLAEMLYRGEIQLLAKAFLSGLSDSRLMGYSERDWQWCLDNEFQIWNYFKSRDLLYKSAPALSRRFLADDPFSKFYLDIDRDSPGWVGIWVDWRIVEAYRAEKPELSLPQLLQQDDPLALLRASHYKPKP